MVNTPTSCFMKGGAILSNLYKNSLLVFMRSKKLIIPYSCMLLLIAAYFVLTYFLVCTLQWENIFSIIMFVSRPCIFLVSLFIYFGYELTAKIYENSMAEYLKTYDQGLMKVYVVILACLLTAVVIPSLMYLAFIVSIYYFGNVQFTPVLVHLIKLWALYFWLAFVIGIVLGAFMAVALKTKRLAVYSLTIVFILLNTTFTDVPFRIPYLLYNSYWVERVLYYVKDFLTVVPHELGSNFTVYPIYGFPMEPIRWLLAVFWVVFPLSLVANEWSSRKTKKVLVAFSCVVLLLGVGLFAGRGSTLQMNMRVDSYPYADPVYYMNRPREDYDRYTAGFYIQEYDMELTISNEMHAKVTLTIDNADLDKHEFTLYHGYILKGVYSEDREIPFVREGDYITINSLNGANTLTFRYHGKSPKYYANRQAITLPGYFAYYPKAGRKNMWDLDRYGYVINVSQHESNYTVKIRSNLNVFSNLEGKNNSFRGKSNAVSLFAGMYAEVAEGIYAEPVQGDRLSRDSIREAERLIRDIYTSLNRPWLTTTLVDKKFFQVPRSFYLNSGTEDIVIMSDHVTSSYYSTGEQLAEAIIRMEIKLDQESFVFGSEYLRYLFSTSFNAELTPQSAVNLHILLEEIAELESLESMENQPSTALSEQDLQIYSEKFRRLLYLRDVVNKKAAKHLFYDSPRREENMRIFFDCFTFEANYLELVDRILREELGQ